MPRVPQSHLDARRRQILDAARRCFLRNGFHATSMQDVLHEAQLSAGAVYRYFPGKDDIIFAIATDALAQVRSVCEPVFDAEAPPPLEEVLSRVFAALERLAGTQDLARLAVQVWGEAVRSPTLAERVSDIAGDMRGFFTRLVVTYQDRGMISPDVPAEHVGVVLAGLAPAFLLQHALLGDVDAAIYGNGIHGLVTGTGLGSRRPSPRPPSRRSKATRSRRGS